jgi:hypothetical protein
MLKAVCLKQHTLKKKCTSKSKKLKKEEKKGPESKNSFDFFDRAVTISSNTSSFPGTWKVHDVALAARLIAWIKGPDSARIKVTAQNSGGVLAAPGGESL